MTDGITRKDRGTGRQQNRLISRYRYNKKMGRK